MSVRSAGIRMPLRRSRNDVFHGPRSGANTRPPLQLADGADVPVWIDWQAPSKHVAAATPSHGRSAFQPIQGTGRSVAVNVPPGSVSVPSREGLVAQPITTPTPDPGY